MSAIKKEQVLNEFDELIEFVSKDEKETELLIYKLRKIKENVELLLKQTNDEELYKGIVNESMREVWDNEKDAIYDEL